MTQVTFHTKTTTSLRSYVSLDRGCQHQMPTDQKLASLVWGKYLTATVNKPAIVSITFLNGETREVIVTHAVTTPRELEITGLMPNGHRLVQIKATFYAKGGGTLTVVG